MKDSIVVSVLVAASLVIAGCSASSEELTNGKKRGGNGGGDDTDQSGDDPNNPDNPSPSAACKDLSKSYTGFGGTDLVAARADENSGVDRARVKPYSSLAGEYQRVLGNTPTQIGTAGPTFGEPPARFSAEPQQNAIAIFTAYRIAFEGCLTYTATDAKYGAAPTADTAKAECAAMQRKFWSRTPETADIDACSAVAVTDSASEANARRRWAYTCASVLTATGFLTY